MSQDQARRPEAEPVKYGDVFYVSGDLASKPIAPKDAAAMQSAENAVFGQTHKGGPASLIQSAAYVNENLGAVGDDDVSDAARDRGVTIAQGVVEGRSVIAEAVGREVVGSYAEPGRSQRGEGIIPSPSPAVSGDGEGRKPYSSPGVGGHGITIGEALEATALMEGDRPVDANDAAAIQAAELRATGRRQVISGGVGAEAQAASMINPRLKDEDKTKLGDVLGDATDRLPCEKEVTSEDAIGIAAAEARNDQDIRPHDGGVARSMVAAARLNQGVGDRC